MLKNTCVFFLTQSCEEAFKNSNYHQRPLTSFQLIAQPLGKVKVLPCSGSAPTLQMLNACLVQSSGSW